MTLRKYAMVAENDVFAVMAIEDDGELNPNGPRWVAGLSSNPVVVEISSEDDVQIGWTWDGENFINPESYN